MAALAILTFLLPFTSSTPTSLTQRDEFCGTDYYGTDWYCTSTATCCSGSWQSTCMPMGYTCCSTGYFCQPDEECWLDTGSLMQYCVAADSDGADATRSAESEGAQETGGGGGNDGDDDDDNDDEDGAAKGVVSMATLSFVVGVGMAIAAL